MIKVKQCAICGREFTTNKPNKRYCSLICRSAGGQLKKIEWLDKNPGYMADYMRKYRKARKINTE